MRICNKCKQEKEESEFKGKDSYCKQCRKEYNREYKKKTGYQYNKWEGIIYGG